MKTIVSGLFGFLPWLLVLCTSISTDKVYAMTDNHPVLIISSYNPDSQQTSNTISDFAEEFQRLGGIQPIALENMNCKSFSEAPFWTERMQTILDKYQHEATPSLIVLIGQEAWAAYLSMNDTVRSRVPVMSALTSRNAIRLPKRTDSLNTYIPQSVDFFNDFPTSAIEAGLVYHYDVARNIRLIRTFYPDTRHIAFISDNTYGGVSLQAYVVKEMKQFPDLDLILLDGRVNSIYTITEKIRKLPPHTAILLGTWRVDMRDGYFMRNATYSMMEAAENVPTFSLTSVGIGYWAIGGVMPAYRAQGKEMAMHAYHILHTSVANRRCVMNEISNEMVLDSKEVEQHNLDLAKVPDEIRFVNQTPTFYEQYKLELNIVIGILIILIIALTVSLYFYYHTKRLRDELQVSEGALRIAKNKAEESNRLKSAFLANISHEIRTPLNSIVGFSDVLSSGDNSPEDQRTYSHIIKTNSDLLLRLINDILDMSRLESDNVSFTPHMCDVALECGQVLASVAQVTQHDNRFEFLCNEPSLMMSVDAQRLQQVILNLLTNADKFTHQGTVTLSIEADRIRRVTTFTVTDTGCGIPADKQEFVFERFEKLYEYAQGTGLGLSICRLIVEKWHGKIWIDSTYTAGARFCFTHPM